MKMYEYHNNMLSIPARLLYEEWEVMAYKTYLSHCIRGKLVRTKEGRGAGNEAFVSFYDLSPKLQEKCIRKLGDPKEVAVVNILEKYIVPDNEAIQFFAQHRKPDGRPLSLEHQREKATNCMILNAIQTVFNKEGVLGKKKKDIWGKMSRAVNMLDSDKWLYNLPGRPRTLQRKFQEYLENGTPNYGVFIHKGEGHDNSRIIKGEIADYILALYCLPIKLTVPELIERYEEERIDKGWRKLDEAAVKNWLSEPEQKRIWMLARHGKVAYDKVFKHTVARDRDLFPNAFWSIDGTKLDWIHIWDESANKQGAHLKVNVVFDVHSEKILGSSYSFTENHIDHFTAIRGAVNESQCRPYLLLYDNQSGHKMSRMQDLYSSLVAVDGGTHFPSRAYGNSNPAEQIFNRFQQQVIKKFWWSDGQGVTVRRDDNKMNIDFIKANRHRLKTVSELEEAWEAAVEIWNNKPHPNFKGQSRNEVYEHNQPMHEPLTVLDIVDKLWITETKRPITYRAHGLDMWIGDNKYQFEVYESDGSIDLEFRRKYVGAKFIVRYDPEFLDGYIQLCQKDHNGNIVTIANAEPKRKHQNVPVLMKEGDKEQWYEDYQVRHIEYERDLNAYKDLMRRSGITPEREMEDQELMIKLKRTLTKDERSRVESEENILNQL